MPYNPGITDISGQLLAEGIRGAAATYAESQDKLRLTDKEIAHLKGTVEFAAKKNILTPEQLAEFNTGNLAKKRELASLAGMAYQDLQDEDFQFDQAKHVVNVPGVGTYIQTGRGGGTFTGGGNAGGDPTPEMRATADAAGWTYLQDADGTWKRVSKRGDATSKPSPAQDIVDAIYADRGRPTKEEIIARRDEIMAASKRATLPVDWGTKNTLGETMAQEHIRLGKELEALQKPKPTAAEIQALAPVRTSAQVKPSAGRGKFAGPIQPASALPLADPLQEPETGDVLPPLPGAKKAVSPAVLAELNAALQKGADKASLLKRLEENGFSTEGLQ